MNFGLAWLTTGFPESRSILPLAERDAGWPYALWHAHSCRQIPESTRTQAAIEKMLKDPELQAQLAASDQAGPPKLPSLVAGFVLGSPEFQRR